MSNGDLLSERLVSSSPGRVGTAGFRLCGWGLLVVFALLVAGLGVVSPAAAQTTVPAKPSGLSAEAGTESVSLSWADPGDDSITGYQYRQRKGKSRWGGWVDVSGSDADTVLHVVSGLDAGVKYRFRIRAQNGDGHSKRSKVVSAVPTAAVRTGTQGEDAAQVSGGVVARVRDFVVVSQSGDTVTLGWKRPASSSCALGTKADYIVRVAETWGDLVARVRVLSDKTGDDVISAKIGGLSLGTSYRAEVIAYSDACDEYSEFVETRWYQLVTSTPTTTTTLAAGHVAPPRDFTASPSGTGVTLSWKRPSGDIGGCALETNTEYIVKVAEWYGTDVAARQVVMSDKTGDDLITATVTGLTSGGTKHRAYVTAYSDACDDYSIYVTTHWFQ